MAKYRILRKVLMVPRPKWMLRLMLSMSPAYYIIGDNEETRKSLRAIYDHIKDSPFFDRRDKFMLKITSDEVAITNKKGRVYLSFYRVRI